MKYKLYIHKGSIAFQQDRIIATEGMAIVADGLGTYRDSHIASEAIVDCFLAYHLAGESFKNVSILADCISTIHRRLAGLQNNQPELKIGGAVFTCLQIVDEEAVIVQLGDSGLKYFCSNDKQIYSTKQHTLVDDLFHNGLITNKNNHPLQHLVSRAIKLDNHKMAKPEVSIINNVKSGDRFVLYSDGLIKCLGLGELDGLLASSATIDTLHKQIARTCTRYMGDNVSFVIIEL